MTIFPEQAVIYSLRSVHSLFIFVWYNQGWKWEGIASCRDFSLAHCVIRMT